MDDDERLGRWADVIIAADSSQQATTERPTPPPPTGVAVKATRVAGAIAAPIAFIGLMTGSRIVAVVAVAVAAVVGSGVAIWTHLDQRSTLRRRRPH